MQPDYSSLGSIHSHNDVFAHHSGEALSFIEGSTPHTIGEEDNTLQDVFVARSDDELPGHSQHDQAFPDIMKQDVSVAKECNFQLPLPFKLGQSHLPDNSKAVYGRTHNTLLQLSNVIARLPKA